MIVKPKIRGFICTTAHAEGCKQNVHNQIEYVKSQTKSSTSKPKKVLIIGSSTGYGLASRITSAFGYNAATIGVFFERGPSQKRTASAGWYNSAAFEQAATDSGLYAKSINGDAFSNPIKQQVIDLIKSDLDQVDLVIYSLASPRRTDPNTNELFNSVLKPIGKTYQDKTVDILSSTISNVEIEPATDLETFNTVKVMGGEDWKLWIEALSEANALAPNAKTVAYSYIGPNMTYPIYRNGTIGKAKEHLESTAKELNAFLGKEGQAFVSVNKGLVTQASSAIPVVPLYISMLYKVMKEKNIHENCIEQMWRLFDQRIYSDKLELDNEGRIRIDDWELREDVQTEIQALWSKVNNDNIESITDMKGYRENFYNLFGFEVPDVDYSQAIDINLNIPSVVN